MPKDQSTEHTIIDEPFNQRLSDIAAEVMKELEQNDPDTLPFNLRASNILAENNVTTYPEFNKKTLMAEQAFQNIKKTSVDSTWDSRMVMSFLRWIWNDA
jgi:hypothetical protein